MTTCKAFGQLKHRFHGEYSAVIALAFDSPEHALDALSVLSIKVKGWSVGEKNKNALVWVGNSEQLEACTSVLVSFGAEEKKIASLAKSIDYGEPFEVSIPIVPQEQVSLF
jgi:hypothetical protein